ncbi:MAG: hypothetical protein H0U13_07845, partial [Gemmatimonadaceae bacterium]|nr:hypothetical protein [Gemmatimonadaceae bacterium]
MKHRVAHKTAINYVKATARSSATVADLPAVIRQVKLQLTKDGHAAQFNRIRSSLQRYLRDTLG